MEHSFNTDVAEKVGIEGAIILKNLDFWISKNIANKKTSPDGNYWTYNSYEAWQELLPYMKLSTIKRVMKQLKDDGYIEISNSINTKDKWNKTNYYRLTDTYYSIVRKLPIEEKKTSHRQEDNSPSYNVQIINTDNKHYSIGEDFQSFKKRFIAKYINNPDLKFFTNGLGWRKDTPFIINHGGLIVNTVSGKIINKDESMKIWTQLHELSIF